MSNKPACVIVVCPLESSVQDQLLEDASMGSTANIAFGRQFIRRREQQMSTALCLTA